MAERVYIALDLETTGLDAARDSIIEIGAVKFAGDRLLERYATLVNPQRPIPSRVTQITGIRDSDVKNAPTIDRVIPELLAFVTSDVAAVIAHNAEFDLGFLRAAGVNFGRPAFDTLTLASILLPGMASYSLGELCATLRIPLVDAHRALDDAQATGQLFQLLHEQARLLPAHTLRLLCDSAEGSDWPLSSFFADAANGQDPALDALPPRWALSSDDWQPLAEHTPAQLLPSAIVKEFFADEGPLAVQLGARYEHRAGQMAMAARVMEALNLGDHLLIEAGTGTGKSLAYLLPAALWSVTNGQRVVVATNTINLQDQLLAKDIPQVQALLSAAGHPPLRAALLKGRQHYLCTRRLRLWRTNHRLSPVELTVLAKVLVWLPHTLTGDADELTLHSAERAIWLRICSDGGSCTPERCERPYDGTAEGVPDRDFYLAARRRAEGSHIVVVNHALLLADLANEGRVLPPYEHLVVDETHRLEEAATDQLTYRVEWPLVQYLLRRLLPDGDLLGQLHRAAAERHQPALVRRLPELASMAQHTAVCLDEFASLLASFARQQDSLREDAGYAQRLRLNGATRSQPLWSRIEIEWDVVATCLAELIGLLGTITEQMQAARWHEDERATPLLADTTTILTTITDLAHRLDEILVQPTGATNQVAWLEVTDSTDAVTVASAPLSVQELIERGLVHQRRSAIFTGATLRTGSGFQFIRERLGLWDVNISTVDSPFDYRRSTLLYLPTDMPLPNDPHYQQGVETAIIEAARAADGRTLVLFTSYQQLRTTAEAIRVPLERLGITMLQHGQSSRYRLLQEFRQTERAVLLGTRSFWEGVDLPGDELTCLLIARLPFAVPSDPLVAARSEEFDDPFMDYTLPDAVLRFRQGFGRLIRRASDRGAVVLLDSRIWRRRYGQAFLDALPECTIRRGPISNLASAIERWLAPQDRRRDQ